MTSEFMPPKPMTSGLSNKNTENSSRSAANAAVQTDDTRSHLTVGTADQTKSQATAEHDHGTRYLNIAAYKFVNLGSLEELRQELKQRCRDLELRGTILLSPEGINLFLAGTPGQMRQWLNFIRSKPEFSDLDAKESFSDKVPFRRMLVRLKKEIIPCGQKQIKPSLKTSPKLPAAELKQWLDEGRSVRLLDVRNDYEVELGTFEGADQLQLGHFRDFSAAIEKLPEESKQEPVVMFCTGGIRCEKAGPIMEEAGFREVYQLDGGILKYFEECGGAHWNGSCFVFDGRVALDTELKPTGNLLCFACQAVLTAEDVSSGRFMFGEYCPRCYRSPEERLRESVLQRQQSILEIARRQPGSTPYTNVREIHVAGRFDGLRLIDFLLRYQPAVDESKWRQWIAEGLLTSECQQPCDCEQVVRAGNAFIQEMPDTVEPQINPNIKLLHQDDSLVVVDKPAPLPCHASGRYNRNSLLSILSQAYPREKLRLAHRLDSLTTGLVVLCRRHRAAREVQGQFAHQTVEKTYIARVHGHPKWDATLCNLPISSASIDEGGIRGVDQAGPAAETRFRVVRRCADGTSLLEALPSSGRTNQIRIHLQQLGHNIVGDNLYGSKKDAEPAAVTMPGKLDDSASRSASDVCMCLHARKLSFVHPDSRQSVTFEAQPPTWFDEQC